MLRREYLKAGTCITSALALLAAVVLTPTGSTHSAASWLSVDHFCHNVANPPITPVRLSLKSVTPGPARVRALPAEGGEQELSDATQPVRHAFYLHFAPTLKSARTSTELSSEQATRPLRC